MTKQDYILFAEMYRSIFARLDPDNHIGEAAVRACMQGTMDIFARDNYRFDRQRFVNAVFPSKKED